MAVFTSEKCGNEESTNRVRTLERFLPRSARSGWVRLGLPRDLGDRDSEAYAPISPAAS